MVTPDKKAYAWLGESERSLPRELGMTVDNGVARFAKSRGLGWERPRFSQSRHISKNLVFAVLRSIHCQQS
jgi:hypothetical protein